MQAATKTFLYTGALIAVMSTATLLQSHVLNSLRAGTLAPIGTQMRGNALMIPIDNIPASRLTDTWGAARAMGRKHEGIDILAPAGTPVRAAASGVALKFHDSARGGITIYEMDQAKQFIFYYAHLQARAGDLREGAAIAQGQVIGYVGATGNATTPHLHFEIQRANAAGWWRGEAFNPYPSLMAGRVLPAN